MSNISYNKLKEDLIASLSQEFVPMTVDLWFNALTIYSYENDRVVLYCDSDYKRSYIEEKYKKDIERHLCSVLNKNIKASIVSADMIDENPDVIHIEDILLSKNEPQQDSSFHSNIPEPKKEEESFLSKKDIHYLSALL